MGGAAGLSPGQLGALDRIAKLDEARSLYLAGGSALAYYFGHRRSEDIDLFSSTPDLDLRRIRHILLARLPSATIRGESDATIKIISEGTAIDVVRYPYPTLEPPRPGPEGILVASLRDLAAMKLAAIARRGIRRDFWDLHVIATSGVSLVAMAADYQQKFGRDRSDLYHVLRALTYFADAESDPLYPQGLTPDRWNEIKSYFEREAPKLIG